MYTYMQHSIIKGYHKSCMMIRLTNSSIHSDELVSQNAVVVPIA